MKRHFPLAGSILLATGLLLAPTTIHLQTATAQQVAPADDALRQLYNDKRRFEELSGAARTALERRFGPKVPLRAPAYPAPVPSAEVPLDGFTNVLVNNPAADRTAQDTQSETTIVLGSGSTVVAAYNDSGSFLGGASKFTGYAVSTDGGTTFVDKGALPTVTGGDAGDPGLARDTTTGTIYFLTLEFSPGNSLKVFRSTDNGQTFSSAVSNGSPGFPTSTFNDKAWITVDNFPGPGNGNVYLGFRPFPVSGGNMAFTRSTDGGATFGPSGGLALTGSATGDAGGQGAFVLVGPDHAVYYFWYDSGNSKRRISVRKSTDLGVSFAPKVQVSANLLATGTNGDLGLNGGFRTNSFPHAAVNPVSGDLYAVYNDRASSADRGNVYLVTSTDGGATWSSPILVNDDGTTNDQFMPTVAVTPDGSRLIVGFYDRRLDPNNSLIGRFSAIATLSGGAVTFAPNFRVSSQSFPVVIGQDPVVNTTYMGDYDQIAADNAFFYSTWGDNRDSNSFHTNQPDVRFAKIPVTGTGTITPTIASFTPASGPVGTPVTMTGTNFTGATAVTFRGAGATFSVNAAGTQINTTVPTGARTGRIRVTTPNGQAVSATVFRVTP